MLSCMSAFCVPIHHRPMPVASDKLARYMPPTAPTCTTAGACLPQELADVFADMLASWPSAVTPTGADACPLTATAGAPKLSLKLKVQISLGAGSSAAGPAVHQPAAVTPRTRARPMPRGAGARNQTDIPMEPEAQAQRPSRGGQPPKRYRDSEEVRTGGCVKGWGAVGVRLFSSVGPFSPPPPPPRATCPSHPAHAQARQAGPDCRHGAARGEGCRVAVAGGGGGPVAGGAAGEDTGGRKGIPQDAQEADAMEAPRH